MTAHGSNAPNFPLLSGMQQSACEKAARLSTDFAFDLRMRALAREGVQHAQEYVERQESEYAKQKLYCDICRSFDCDHIPA